MLNLKALGSCNSSVKVTNYSCEKIGYFSVVNEQLADPVFKTLDVRAIKQINHDEIPLNCSQRVPVTDNKDSIGHLLQFLKKNNVFEKHLDAKEFNVIARSNCLRTLLAVDSHRKEAFKVKCYKYMNQNTTVLEETHRTKTVTTAKCEIVEMLLSMLPEGRKEKHFGSHLLLVVVKHKYTFSNGITVNLFVSKDIHSVIKRGEEIIPIELRYNDFADFATAASMDKYVWKAMVLSFLAGGLSRLMAVPISLTKDVDRVTLIDDTSALCKGNALNNFKAVLEKFLVSLTRMKDCDIVKSPPMWKENVPTQEVQYCSKSGLWIRMCFAAQTFVRGPVNVYYENSSHDLVIIGTHAVPIPYERHFYNADFITLKNFRDGLFLDILQKPKSIKFYGTRKEYEKLHRLLTEEQLAKLSFGPAMSSTSF